MDELCEVPLAQRRAPAAGLILPVSRPRSLFPGRSRSELYRLARGVPIRPVGQAGSSPPEIIDRPTQGLSAPLQVLYLGLVHPLCELMKVRIVWMRPGVLRHRIPLESFVSVPVVLVAQYPQIPIDLTAPSTSRVWYIW